MPLPDDPDYRAQNKLARSSSASRQKVEKVQKLVLTQLTAKLTHRPTRPKEASHMEELEIISTIWIDTKICRWETGVAEIGVDPGPDTAGPDVAGPDVAKPQNYHERRKSALEHHFRYLQARSGTVKPKLSAVNLAFACAMLQDQRKPELAFKWQYRKKADINMNLLAHQVIGAAWMANSERMKEYGGLLFDEVGSGKTITCCVAIRQRMHDLMITKDYTKPTLLIVPGSVISQWEATAQRLGMNVEL